MQRKKQLNWDDTIQKQNIPTTLTTLKITKQNNRDKWEFYKLSWESGPKVDIGPTDSSLKNELMNIIVVSLTVNLIPNMWKIAKYIILIRISK